MICTKLQSCIEQQLGQEEACTCSNRSECIQSSDCRSEVKCEENRKKYILVNTQRNHVILYKMDEGIIVEDRTVPAKTNKCDYLYVINSDGLVGILTELKGVDVPKALTQLNGTLDLFHSVFDVFKQVHGRIIVTSSTPNLKATPAYTNLARKIQKKYNGSIKIVEKQLSEKDIELQSVS